MVRVCKKCGEEKEIEEFYKNKKCKFGYGWACERCKRDWHKQYKKNYTKSSAEYNKKYYQDNKKKLAAKNKKYRINNIGRENKRKIQYYRNNKDIYLERMRKYNNYQIVNLTDSYIKFRITQTNNLDYKDITPQMIDLKRELIIFHRLKEEVRNGINSGGNQRATANGQAV